MIFEQYAQPFQGIYAGETVKLRINTEGAIEGNTQKGTWVEIKQSNEWQYYKKEQMSKSPLLCGNQNENMNGWIYFLVSNEHFYGLYYGLPSQNKKIYVFLQAELNRKQIQIKPDEGIRQQINKGQKTNEKKVVRIQQEQQNEVQSPLIQVINNTKKESQSPWISKTQVEPDSYKKENENLKIEIELLKKQDQERQKYILELKSEISNLKDQLQSQISKTPAKQTTQSVNLDVQNQNSSLEAGLKSEIDRMGEPYRIKNISSVDTRILKKVSPGTSNLVGEVNLVEVVDDKRKKGEYVVKNYPCTQNPDTFLFGLIELLNNARIPRNHPNIVPLRGYQLKFDQLQDLKGQKVDAVREFSLCFDYVDGLNLQQFVTSQDFAQMPNDGKKKQLILDIVLGVSRAVYMMHSVGLIHNDIKPQNVMVKYDAKTRNLLDVYLIDLGAGMIQMQESVQNTATLYQLTETYAAPEAVVERRVEKKSDIWSLGCLLYFMATGGNRPWSQYEIYPTVAMTRNYDFLGDLKEETKKAILWIRSLLDGCLQYDLDKRKSILDVISEILKLSEENNQFTVEDPDRTVKFVRI